MKKNVEKQIKTKENRQKEKGVSLLEMWRQFWNADSDELSQEEEILKDERIGIRNREALLKALRVADNIMKPTGKQSKVPLANLNVNNEKAVEKSLKRNPVRVNNKKTKSKTKEDDDKMQEI